MKNKTAWKIWTLSLEREEAFDIVKTQSNSDAAHTQDPFLKNISFSKLVSQQAQSLPKNKLFQSH